MANKWPLTNSSEYKRLSRVFQNRSIDFSKVGFYDEPRFVAEERANPRFLETYARLVEARNYDDHYLATARQKIAVAAEALRSAVEKDGRLGACVDASGMLGRMLDRLSVWNYVAKATLTIEFRDNAFSPRYFWVIDDGNFVAAHAFVVAPPFGVVDVTVGRQPYSAGEAFMLPSIVLADDFKVGVWNVNDLVNPAIRLAAEQAGYMPFERFLEERHSDMLAVMAVLPARYVSTKSAKLKYVPVAVGGMIEPLEQMTGGYKPSGRTALEVFEQDVLPRLTE